MADYLPEGSGGMGKATPKAVRVAAARLRASKPRPHAHPTAAPSMLSASGAASYVVAQPGEKRSLQSRGLVGVPRPCDP